MPGVVQRWGLTVRQQRGSQEPKGRGGGGTPHRANHGRREDSSKQEGQVLQAGTIPPLG